MQDLSLVLRGAFWGQLGRARALLSRFSRPKAIARRSEMGSAVGTMMPNSVSAVNTPSASRLHMRVCSMLRVKSAQN